MCSNLVIIVDVWPFCSQSLPKVDSWPHFKGRVVGVAVPNCDQWKEGCGGKRLLQVRGTPAIVSLHGVEFGHLGVGYTLEITQGMVKH